MGIRLTRRGAGRRARALVYSVGDADAAVRGPGQPGRVTRRGEGRPLLITPSASILGTSGLVPRSNSAQSERPSPSESTATSHMTRRK